MTLARATALPRTARNTRQAVLSLAVLVVTMVGCSRSNSPQTSSQTHTSTATPTTADTEADTVGCMFVAQTQHSDPEALVREYLRRDSIGEFLSSSQWETGARTCPGHEAGFDAATVVTSYDVVQLSRTATAASYLVTYHVLGPMSDDSVGGLTVKPELERDTFPVVHTQVGWRIASTLDLDPHISPHAATMLQVKARDRRILDSAAAVGHQVITADDKATDDTIRWRIADTVTVMPEDTETGCCYDVRALYLEVQEKGGWRRLPSPQLTPAQLPGRALLLRVVNPDQSITLRRYALSSNTMSPVPQPPAYDSAYTYPAFYSPQLLLAYVVRLPDSSRVVIRRWPHWTLVTQSAAIARCDDALLAVGWSSDGRYVLWAPPHCSGSTPDVDSLAVPKQ